MAKVLFIYRNPRSFIHQDQQILESAFSVNSIRVKGSSSYLKVLKAIPDSDLVFIWFGNWWSAYAVRIARRYNKPSIIVGGGYDVVDIPSIRYGLMGHPMLGPIARDGFRQATKVSTFSQHSRESLYRYTGVQSEVIYCGIDPTIYYPAGDKEKVAVTIGRVTRQNLERKGIKYFVQSAIYLPNISFRIIGECEPRARGYLERFAPDNVEFLGYLPESELITQLQRAAVYVQASRHEGFGVALAEAMLCECVPVVTREGALSEVVGKVGVYVPTADPVGLARGIEEALSSSAGPTARTRIEDNYSSTRRNDLLIKFVDSVLQSSLFYRL